MPPKTISEHTEEILKRLRTVVPSTAEDAARYSVKLRDMFQKIQHGQIAFEVLEHAKNDPAWPILVGYCGRLKPADILDDAET
jgi:hypothetical protein